MITIRKIKKYVETTFQKVKNIQKTRLPYTTLVFWVIAYDMNRYLSVQEIQLELMKDGICIPRQELCSICTRLAGGDIYKRDEFIRRKNSYGQFEYCFNKEGTIRVITPRAQLRKVTYHDTKKAIFIQKIIKSKQLGTNIQEKHNGIRSRKSV